MTHFQRERKKKKERYQAGIQYQENPLNEKITNQSVFSNKNFPNSSEIYSGLVSPNIKSQNIGRLVEGLEKLKAESKNLKEKAKNASIQNRRSVQLNMMRLQDKQFQLKGNVFNITIGQIIDREGHLQNLTQEINQLKSKIKALQDEQNEQFRMSRNIQDQERETYKSIDPILDRSRTIQSRKSQCGRIYTRLKSPFSGRTSKYRGKNIQSSSYYKWVPKVGESNALEEEKYHKTLNFTQKASLRYPSTSQGRRKNETQVQKPISAYRVKHKNLNRGMTSQIECQTEALITLDPKLQMKQNEQSLKNQPNPEKNEVEIQVEPYSGIVFQRQLVPQWEITKIQDDFRSKIVKKLQIPSDFPLKAPQTGETLQEYEKLGPKIFQAFGVKLNRQKKKIITRKFKNGLYYQLDEGKNVVWYYSGTFYFGDWEVDLPTQSQKNGFGFEYVPQKYIYLGHFKEGMRHGKGTIKIFSSNPNSPNDFVAYDGEWENGKPNGLGRHIDQKNTKYIGDFKAGEKTGKAIILNKDGLYYQGEVKKNLKHGFGFQRLINEDTYMGQFQEGKFNGTGTYKWKNGSIYEGQFVNGKRQGKGKWTGPNGDSFQGEYFEDIKNGWGKFTWANGEIYQGQFRNDIRHGQGTYKHPNGKTGKFLWVDGQIDHRIYSKQEEQYRSKNLKQAETPPLE